MACLASMKITAVVAQDLALKTFSGGSYTVHAVLRITTDEGVTGISRTTAPLVGIIRDELAPLLVGQNPLNIERLWQRMYARIGEHGGSAREFIAAIGSVDIGLWDLKGKILGLPIHRLLGGYRDDVPVYADGGMFARGPQGMADWSARQAEAGFSAVKYHVMGEAPDEIVETVRVTRSAIGRKVRLMVDVHKLWDPWTAVDVSRRLEQYDVFWLEEPLRWDDEVSGMAYLAANTRIAIAAGESESTLYAARELVQHAGIKVLQVDIVLGGGYTPWVKMAAVAAAHHVYIAPHGATFTELAAPFVAAMPNSIYVDGFPQGEPNEVWSRLYVEPLELRDGTAFLRDAPGLGLEFDEAFLAAHLP